MNMKNHYLNSSIITIIAVLFVLLIAAGCSVILQKQADLQKQKRHSLSTADTSTWKTYRNEQYGFEFKYPASWRQKASDRNSELLGFILSSPDFQEASIVSKSKNQQQFSIPIIKSGQRLKFMLDTIQTTPQDILQTWQQTGAVPIDISGIEGMYKEDGYYDWNMRVAFTPSREETRMFNIWFEGLKKDRDNNYLIFSQILSTFKFISK